VRLFVMFAASVCLSACAHAQPATTRATTSPATIAFRGCAKIDATTRDQLARPFTVCGLSGITHAGANRYWAVLDNNDKLVWLQIDLSSDGSITATKVGAGLTLADRRDFEGIAFNGGSVFLSEENTPGVHEYALDDGRRLRTLPTPDVFLNGHMVRNRGFESLTKSVDGKSLWTANEHALRVDGTPESPAEPFGSTTRVRLLRYELDDKGNVTPREQFVYQTAGVVQLGGFNSLADLVALPDGRLLALERSGGQDLAGKTSIRTRIFLVTIDDAQDVSGMPALPAIDQPLRKVHKQLLFDANVCDANGENVEGLCLGPKLGPGRWALVGVVDDGDGPMKCSQTQIVAFELDLHEDSLGK